MIDPHDSALSRLPVQDSTDRLFVVVSGIPASGKTTIAKRLAPALHLPLIDKDEILEALFETLESTDLASRQTLSRASDAVLKQVAESSRGAVLCSFWRHPLVTSDSGTPFHWISSLSNKVVEVYCCCPPQVALARFKARHRHPGHRDLERSDHELVRKFTEWAERGPLGAGRLLTIRTDQNSDLEQLSHQLSKSIQAA